MISVEYSAAWIRERSRTNGCFFPFPPRGSCRSLGSQSSRPRDAHETPTRRPRARSRSATGVGGKRRCDAPAPASTLLCSFPMTGCFRGWCRAAGLSALGFPVPPHLPVPPAPPGQPRARGHELTHGQGPIAKAGSQTLTRPPDLRAGAATGFHTVRPSVLPAHPAWIRVPVECHLPGCPQARDGKASVVDGKSQLSRAGTSSSKDNLEAV